MQELDNLLDKSKQLNNDSVIEDIFHLYEACRTLYFHIVNKEIPNDTIRQEIQSFRLLLIKINNYSKFILGREIFLGVDSDLEVKNICKNIIDDIWNNRKL